ncbi:hypothetical protein [Euzebya pacifica]|nr:hypothetical protein [Euzebya pacifica]
MDASTNDLPPLPAGVYRHNDPAKVGPGSRGHYLLIVEARDHVTGEEKVVYVPLYDRAEWGDTLRASIRTRADFESSFTHVGRGIAR